jgi:dihydroorotase
LLYKCGWSPLEGTTFSSKVSRTLVSGKLVYDNGLFQEDSFGMAIDFTQ